MEAGWGGRAETLLNLSPGSSIHIRYHDLFGSHDDLLLLEVDDKLLSEVLQNRVTIRGQPEGDGVLCTQSATYVMKFVGTSNSVFLIPPGEPIAQSSDISLPDKIEPDNPASGTDASAIKLAPGHIELIQTAPKLDKLKLLLLENPYSIEDAEQDPRDARKRLYGWEDLLDLVQASEDELKAGLKSLSAVEIDGYWRIVDDRAMDEILDMILNLSVLHGWPLHALDEDAVLSAMESNEFNRVLVLHCLDTYGSRTCGMEGYLWSMDERRVCLRIARRTLHRGKMKLESFMEMWRRSIPSEMNADLQMLEGEALYEEVGHETWIRSFSVASLSSTPAERFAALFRERPKWEWKDLEPYIRDLRVPGISAEGLLIKYTRRTQPSADVEPVFSAR